MKVMAGEAADVPLLTSSPAQRQSSQMHCGIKTMSHVLKLRFLTLQLTGGPPLPQVLLFVFSILRKVAWDYGRLALVTDADR